MGGYIGLPVCLAAAVSRIEINLFELNVVPGKAILWLLRRWPKRSLFVLKERLLFLRKEKLNW